MFRSMNKKVGLLALDVSSAFDIISHSVILDSFGAIGGGPRILAWCQSFLSGCSQFVEVGPAKSASWTSDRGSGQGKRLSPPLFNLGSMSQCFWTVLSIVTNFADDSMDLVFGDTAKECDDKLRLLVSEKVKWYANVGLPLNAKKSELLGIGFTPSPLTIEGNVIEPKQAITFLGLTISSDLKMDSHVSNVCNKLRAAAGRIRSEGRFFTIGDRRLLFNAWCRGTISSNALAYLPSCTSTQLDKLNTALNCGIRAVASLPRYGKAPVSAIRIKLNLPSVWEIKDYVLAKNAWKNRSEFLLSSSARSGPLTRGKSNYILPHPVQKGSSNNMVSTQTTLAWNRLPLPIKEEQNPTKAMAAIKRIFFPSKNKSHLL